MISLGICSIQNCQSKYYSTRAKRSNEFQYQNTHQGLLLIKFIFPPHMPYPLFYHGTSF